jgi:phage terminase Nu1 subunit (DNA packaging protein)
MREREGQELEQATQELAELEERFEGLLYFVYTSCTDRLGSEVEKALDMIVIPLRRRRTHLKKTDIDSVTNYIEVLRQGIEDVKSFAQDHGINTEDLTDEKIIGYRSALSIEDSTVLQDLERKLDKLPGEEDSNEPDSGTTIN